MRHDDICVITRTSTNKTPGTNIAKSQTTTLDPFKCRLGRVTGTLTQGQPQGTLVQQMRIYIPDVTIDIQSGDIASITIAKLNTTGKYIVGNVYKPNSHHIEADVTYKKEV